MTAIYLARTSLLLPFIRFLNQIGAPTERLLNQAKISPLLLDNPEALLPTYLMFRFVEQAAHQEGIDGFGLIVGQTTQILELGLFGHLLCHSLTLFDLLQTLERTLRSLSSGEQAWVTETPDWVWLHHRYRWDSAPHVAYQQTRLYATVLYLKAFQLALGENWHSPAIHLQLGESRKLANLDLFAKTHLSFAQASGAIAVPRSLLSMPLNRLPNLQPLKNTCEALQASTPAANFVGSLRQLLQSLLPYGPPDIQLAAAAAGMSRRSFQRRLTENQLNYSQLIEQIRLDMAVQSLQDPTIKLVEIADELGYTDAANFTRAFKRWTGVSPRQFRRLHFDL